MEKVEKWNEDSIEPLTEAQKKDAKKKEKEAENFYFKSGAYENPAKNR